MRCKIYIIFFTIFAAVFQCCNKKSEVFLSLETADSLLSEDCDSLAAMFFYQIEPPEDTIAELPFYNYMLSRISCRNYDYQDPELLDLPIAFFKQNGDNKRLAYSYCYKSIFLLNYSSDMSSAMIYNKMAEDLAKNTDDDILKYNIYSTGYSIAADCFDTQECLNGAETPRQQPYGVSRQLYHYVLQRVEYARQRAKIYVGVPQFDRLF